MMVTDAVSPSWGHCSLSRSRARRYFFLPIHEVEIFSKALYLLQKGSGISIEFKKVI